MPHGAPGAPEAPLPAVREEASWIELFLDLVVVAGIGLLTHLLHDGPTLDGLALYTLAYFAFWTAWTGLTVYSSVQGERARITTLLLGMAGMAVLAASATGLPTSHATAFTVAYILLRLLAGRVWRPGTVVVDWPLAQAGVGTLPWIASLWTDGALRSWLWALGIALDFIVLFTVSGSRMLSDTLARIERSRARSGPGRGPARQATAVAARVRLPHMAERLGLYVIIILGEGVIQTVTALSEVPWTAPVVATSLGAFMCLIGLWALGLVRGFAGIP
ncbi:low temperature requirement protein A [Streptomyces sp. NPDC059875]|uniref:low temperature requirement protein A n=1 Tax=unclassified Streptomyces TaxID=2593676 RepID=UPI0036466751